MSSVSDEIELCFHEFMEELKLARKLLTSLKVREIRIELRSIRPIALLRDEFGPIRRYFKEFVDNVSKVALPLILVFCVSSLEKFLRSIWELRFGSYPKKFRKIFSNPKCFAKHVRKKFGVEIGPLTYRANAVAMKRHILLHRGGVIDKDALKVFREAGIRDLKENQKLLLTVENVEDDIKILEEFADAIRNIFVEH